MELSIAGSMLIILFFLTMYALMIVLGVHFIFRKNLILMEYVLIGIAIVGVLISYYYALFGSMDTRNQSLLLTVALIVLIQRRRKRKKSSK